MSKRVRIITVVAASLAALVAAAGVALCIVFPNKYAKNIDAAAAEFGLNSALVKSVVWAESKFDNTATSVKGAAGLMQLMPETYKRCAKVLGISTAENAEYDVDNSLRCGCYFLSLLIEKYDGNTEHALMAYNAGETNADRFIAGEAMFEETREYVKRVAFANRVYSVVAAH